MSEGKEGERRGGNGGEAGHLHYVIATPSSTRADWLPNNLWAAVRDVLLAASQSLWLTLPDWLAVVCFVARVTA